MLSYVYSNHKTLGEQVYSGMQLLNMIESIRTYGFEQLHAGLGRTCREECALQLPTQMRVVR